MKTIFPLTMLACLGTASATDPPRQPDAIYESAVSTISTAPDYVLITTVDARTGDTRTGCTTANLLHGAIAMEYRVEDDEEGHQRVVQIAVRNTRHVFVFKNRRALENVRFAPTDADLARVREALRGLSVQQVMDTLYGSDPAHRHGPDASSLAALIEGRSAYERHEALRDAVACVLVERGKSVSMGDLGDVLSASP